MDHLKKIKIAAAFVTDEEILPQHYLSMSDLSSEIATLFHPLSTCFCYDKEGALPKRRKLLKTALFEDYRLRGIAYLLWINRTMETGLREIKELVNECEKENLMVAALPGSGKDNSPEIIVTAMKCIKEFSHAYPYSRWFEGDGNPEQLFLSQLKQIGYPVQMLNIKPGETPLNSPGPFRLPSVVSFSNHFYTPPSGTEKEIKELLEIVKKLKSKKKIVIYGAGTIARAILPIIKNSVTLIVDINPELKGTKIDSIPVEQPEALISVADKSDAIFISLIGREKEVRSYLKELLPDHYDFQKVIGLDGVTGREIEPPSQLFSEKSIDITVENFKSEIKRVELMKTTDREITQRGVLYVGFPCNIKCVFCYYAYAPFKNEWHSIEECKRDADLYRKEFNNLRVDITGGEPTIYSEIYALLDHCVEIGLTPSMITNMQALAKADNVKKFKSHGVYDFLCSVHAYGKEYETITQKDGSWRKVVGAVENLLSQDMKWRVNCTITAINRPQLQKIAQFAFQNGARVINFINFNPFREWADRTDIEFQSSHSEVWPYLEAALSYCDEVGLEANVRFFPFCKMKGHEEKCYNYSQLSYDSHEWDFCSWLSEKTRNPTRKFPASLFRLVDNEEEFHLYIAHKVRLNGFVKGAACRFCSMNYICDGFLKQYAGRYGFTEMEAYEGELIMDPKHFIKNQLKVVDE